jgi:ribosomal protein S18 acetylase RimI-like enzyme
MLSSRDVCNARAVIMTFALLPLFLSANAFPSPQKWKVPSRFRNCVMVAHKCTAGLDFCMEQVSDRRRTLDVMVFRGFSCSANEYVHQYKQENHETLSEQEAVLRLTSGIDDNGQDTNVLGGPVVSFVAISDDAEFARTNGVVAAVDAKRTTDCILVKNLHVNERVRRRGLASALIMAVKHFARTTQSVDEIVLNVERQNQNAIALYLKERFQFDEHIKGDGRMVCDVFFKMKP